mmetsp:Transcript_16493/g.19782  ORF Transcript_16493/g.19782 Transcript_16493/m.19782 type:complete len:95 (-) Transcript_16493:58-342(-)
MAVCVSFGKCAVWKRVWSREGTFPGRRHRQKKGDSIYGYESIKSNKGSTTNATKALEPIDGMSIKRIEKLQAQLKDESWKPKPARLQTVGGPGT